MLPYLQRPGPSVFGLRYPGFFRELGMKKLHANRFVIAYTIALLSLAAVGYYFEIYRPHAAVHKAATQQYFSTDLTYYDLPRISMNMKSSSKTGHVNIDISLEVAKKDAWRLEDFKSRITDRIVTYMYKQELDQMRPPKDIAWLHRDLLRVINTANQPVVVHDVLFRQFVIM